MKQYRFKIDTPWGKKGDSVPRNIEGFCSQFCINLVSDSHYSSFPSLFEEIEVKSDSVIVHEFISWIALDLNIPYAKQIADYLLSENAINQEWLKKKRGEG